MAAAPGAGFLILHGYEGNGPGHWQTWLAERLGGRGYLVAYPSLPEPFDPNPDAWAADVRALLDEAQTWTVVCHSLACWLWARLAAAGGNSAGRVALVAPPGPSWVTATLPGWARVSWDAQALATAARETLLVLGADDPYLPTEEVAFFDGLGLDTVHVAGGAHLNIDAGYGPWPAMERWCVDGTFVAVS